MEDPKRITPRSKPYKAFIRTRPCEVCRRVPSEAAHLFGQRGTGIKPSDFCTGPLCTAHHRECHRLGIESFAKNYHLNVYVIAYKNLYLFLHGRPAHSGFSDEAYADAFRALHIEFTGVTV